MNVSDRIQNLRKGKGITQEELADQIGVSRQAVSKWESEQSLPDLDKVIVMSEYFGVTTDYLLKGIEPSVEQTHRDSTNSSKVLYILSTMLIAIGLLSAVGSWHEEQLAEDIWGSMIIQAVGAALYFIGKTVSAEKPAFAINWLNTVIVAFIPISMLAALVTNSIVAPYPTDRNSGLVFVVCYATAAVVSFILLKKHAHDAQ